MFVVKLRTPSRANYEYFHFYLAYRRQTGTVVTRQTYDRAPRLTKPPTAHISRGVYHEAITKNTVKAFIYAHFISLINYFRSPLFLRIQSIREIRKY